MNSTTPIIQPARLAVIVLAISTALCADVAHPDVINAAWITNSSWIYEIGHMPDIDQRRSALDNDGKMYCFPSAVLNKLMYLGNHGYPALAPAPGSGNWQAPWRFDAASAALQEMGELMNTDPAKGTGGLGGDQGARQWINSRYPGMFSVNAYWRSNSYWPNVTKMGKTALAGGLVSFVYGRYEYTGDATSTNFTLGERKGGHVITLAKAAQSARSTALESRDPWHEAPSFDLATQSVFSNRIYDVGTHILFPGTWPFIVHSLDAGSAGDTVALVDGYLAIFPVFGYGYTPGGHSVDWFKPIKIAGSQSPASNRFDFSRALGAEAAIVHAAMHPDMTSMFAIVNTPAGKMLAEKGAFGEEVSVLLELPNARRLTFGRNRLLYVLEHEVLHQIHVDIIPDAPGDPHPIQSMSLPFIADAIDFMDTHDMLGVLSVSEHAIMLYRTDPGSDDLPFRPARVNIAAPLQGAASIAFPPDRAGDETRADDPFVWLISDASDDIFKIALSDGSVIERVEFPEITKPKSISVNDGGDLFIGTPTGLFQLSKSGNDWRIVPSLFEHDEVRSEQFMIARSRSNYHPALHDGPGWENFLLDDNEVNYSPDDQVLRDRFEVPAANHH